MRCPDEMRLSRWWYMLALFSVALSGREAFESLVVFLVALAGRDALESLVALFSIVLAGREMFECGMGRGRWRFMVASLEFPIGLACE
ncbi:MAG: hypothetical protein H7836_15985 [Magnetococcus sp. YQC-3]